MNLDTQPGSMAAMDRFDRIEATLSRYPELSVAELADLEHWFRKEASAFEVASLASKDHLRDAYQSYRAEHIDRWRSSDLIAPALIIGVLASCALVAMLAM